MRTETLPKRRVTASHSKSEMASPASWRWRVTASPKCSSSAVDGPYNKSEMATSTVDGDEEEEDEGGKNERPNPRVKSRWRAGSARVNSLEL